MEFPLVSIILPTYNGKSERIENSIKSVLNQSFTNFELIIINDGSRNNIQDKIDEIKQIDNRILSIINKNNLRIALSLNKGIESSKGKYISRIDDDDIWVNKNKLKDQVIFLENNPDYGVVGGSAIYINEAGKNIGVSNIRSSNDDIKYNILSFNPFFHSSIVIRKSLLYKYGFYKDSFVGIEDYELFLRLGKYCKFYNFSDYFIKYRIQTSSLNSKKIKRVRLLSLLLTLKYFFAYPNGFKALIKKLILLILPETFIRKYITKIT